jgi:hypothetical protein
MIQQDRNMLFTMAVCFGTSMGFAGIGFLLMVEANAQTFASVLVLYFIAGTVLSLGLYQASRSSKLAFRKLTYHLAMKCVNYQLSFGLAGLPVSLLSPISEGAPIFVLLYVLVSGFILSLSLPIIYARPRKEFLNEPVPSTVAP